MKAELRLTLAWNGTVFIGVGAGNTVTQELQALGVCGLLSLYFVVGVGMTASIETVLLVLKERRRLWSESVGVDGLETSRRFATTSSSRGDEKKQSAPAEVSSWKRP